MKRLKCESRRCCSHPTPPTPPSPRRSSRVSSSSSVHSAVEEEVLRHHPLSSFHMQGDHPQPSAVALLPVVYFNPAHAPFPHDGRWVVGGEEEEGCCDQNKQNCSPCHHPRYHPRYCHRPSSVPPSPYCGYDSRCQRQAHLLSHMYFNNAFSHPPPSTWYPSHGHYYGYHGHGHHHGRKWSDMPHCNQAGVGWGWRGC